MKKLFEQLDEASLRMGAVVILAGMLNDGHAMADPLRELLEDEDDEALKQCFPDLPPLVLAERDEDQDLWREAFHEWALDSQKLGFLIRFERPVMAWSADGQAASFSWGRYGVAWLYGDTLAKAVARGKQWAKEREAAEKAAI